MQAGKTILLSTLATRDFLGALAQNVGMELNLDVKSSGLGVTVDCRVRSIRVISVDNLAWEIQLFRTDTFGDLTTPDADEFAGMHAFASTDGKQSGTAAGTGLWHYHVGNLDIPYNDEDRTSELHLVLMNRSAGAKAGAIRVELGVEETLGQ